MKFDIIIPIYNSFIGDVPSINVCLREENCTIVICDNSTDVNVKRANQRYFESNLRGHYLDMGGNQGLSRAYNRGIRIGHGEVVCLFDDDTTLSLEYFSQVEMAIGSNGSGVYIPIIESGDRMLSPLGVLGPLIYKIDEVSKIDLNTTTAFNTGMAITRDVAEMIPHDEECFLDFVDHAFCRDAHSHGVKFNLLKGVKLQQDYSRYTDTRAAALHRQRIAIPDIRHFYGQEGPFYRLYGALYCFWIKTRNSLKYRDAIFLLNENEWRSNE